MSIIRIPLISGVPHFKQQTQLDDVTYGFQFRWNEREEAWYMDLLDYDDEPITSGRKLCAGMPLLHRCTDSRRPEGQLIVVDLTGENEDPTLDDLGSRVVILYFDTEALEAL